MRYLSVCSGIEAATVAWPTWTPVAFSEIEPFPCAVLAHHYPETPNWGDMTRYKEWPDADVDVLVGGTPCQSFSIAGLRGGLADERGNLALEYLRLAQRIGPRWLVWENVPGVLSSNGGRDFGSILGGLAEIGYGFAYRVLDAQYFGVPQRRRRVFVVGYLGDWRPAAAVLFERESMQRIPPQKRSEIAETFGVGYETRCLGCGVIWEPDGGLECCPVCGAMQSWCAEICGTLNDGAHMGGGLNGQDATSGRLLVDCGLPRRLTPLECERLQGFPDDYTAIPWRNKPADQCPDGPRYKALGNSMAVPCMRWIGQRIAMVEQLKEEMK
jgi:DNA (cytosine-5)-methyltransferase 1